MLSPGPQQGEEPGGGGGGTPCLALSHHPSLLECEEEEGKGGKKGFLQSPGVEGEETDVRSWKSVLFFIFFFFLWLFPPPHTTEFTSYSI